MEGVGSWVCFFFLDACLLACLERTIEELREDVEKPSLLINTPSQ
jgi:hypothetical protein